MDKVERFKAACRVFRAACGRYEQAAQALAESGREVEMARSEKTAALWELEAMAESEVTP